MALFEALEEDRVLKEVMRCRAVEIKGDMPQAQKDYYNAMKRRYALPLPEQEKRQQSALVAALMGDGKVDEVMACMKKKQNAPTAAMKCLLHTVRMLCARGFFYAVRGEGAKEYLKLR